MIPRLLALLAAGLCPVMLASCMRSQDPADTIQRAYSWYHREVKQGRDPLGGDHGRVRAYVTEAFLTSIEHFRPELEDSPYLDGKLEAKLMVDNVETKGNFANAHVILNGRTIGVITLRVQLVREAGSWKIDDAKVVEG